MGVHDQSYPFQHTEVTARLASASSKYVSGSTQLANNAFLASIGD